MDFVFDVQVFALSSKDAMAFVSARAIFAKGLWKEG